MQSILCSKDNRWSKEKYNNVGRGRKKSLFSWPSFYVNTLLFHAATISFLLKRLVFTKILFPEPAPLFIPQFPHLSGENAPCCITTLTRTSIWISVSAEVFSRQGWVLPCKLSLYALKKKKKSPFHHSILLSSYLLFQSPFFDSSTHLSTQTHSAPPTPQTSNNSKRFGSVFNYNFKDLHLSCNIKVFSFLHAAESWSRRYYQENKHVGPLARHIPKVARSITYSNISKL